MIISFKKKFPWNNQPTNFEEKVLSVQKIHTMRHDKHGRWNPGKKIHFSTGVRTTKYNCFMHGACKSVQAIQINYYEPGHYPDVIIDGMILGKISVEKLAKNDGFDSVEDFFKWFSEDFHGRLIQWTDFKYETYMSKRL